MFLALYSFATPSAAAALSAARQEYQFSRLPAFTQICAAWATILNDICLRKKT